MTKQGVHSPSIEETQDRPSASAADGLSCLYRRVS